MRQMKLTALALTTALAIGGGAFVSGHLNAQGPGGRGAGRAAGPGGPGEFGRGGRGPGRGGPGGPGGPMGINPMVLRQLDLTDAQRDRVKEIMDRHRDEQRALGDRARAAHEALDAAIATSPLDESAIRGKAADAAAVEADIAVAGGRTYSEVFSILTADQQAKLKTLQAEQAARRQKPPSR